MSYDLLIAGGTVLLDGAGATRCELAIADGRIAALLAPGSQPPACRRPWLSSIAI